MLCIIGLGNPGQKYNDTRHNAGFMVLDHFAAASNIPLVQKQLDSLFGKGQIETKNVFLAKPLTFMNRSGSAVGRILRYYKLSPDNLLVVHDDLDLPAGRIRIVKNGGPGGHNGVASIIESLGSQNFDRLKIGIGRPTPPEQPEDYVLKPFSVQDKAVIEEVLERAVAAIGVIIRKGITPAMNIYNVKTRPPQESAECRVLSTEW
ncbi:MAG: aminoacyl-tRNA hydrolase [Pseudomonadota bacterium]